MKRIHNLIGLLFLSITLFTSCAMHDGVILNSGSLSSNNFSYVQRDAMGTAKATYVFGLGGLGKFALIDNAKSELISKYPIKDNQALVNVTLNWKTSFIFPFVFTKRCIITGDIVEFK
jgi:hypothetical protein